MKEHGIRKTRLERAAKGEALGPVARQAVLALLGLDDVSPAAQVRGGTLETESVVVEVGTLGAPGALFEICRDEEGAEAWISTGKLRVVHWGKEGALPSAWITAVSRHARERLAGRTWESLRGELKADPAHGRSGEPLAADPRLPKTTSADMVHWGQDWIWSDFFAEYYLRRCAIGSVGTLTFSRVILHGDDECLQEQPWATAPLLPLAESPWRAATFELDGVSESWTTGGLGVWALSRLVSTDLSERDVICGAADKASHVLESELERRDVGDYGPVLYNHTCVPTVVGEDYESWVSKTAQNTGARLHVLTPDPRSALDMFAQLVDGLNLRAGRSDAHNPHGINLFGIPRTQALDEVRNLLDALGLSVHAVALPQLLTRSMTDASRAAISVFAINSAWEPFYDIFESAIDVPAIRLEAPFGWHGTRRWLDRILRELNRPLDEDSWHALTKAHSHEWKRVRDAAGTVTLGLVAGRHASRYLCDPARTFGVPLIRLLEELGFKLDIWFREEDRSTDATERDRLLGELIEPTRHAVNAYGTWNELQSALADSPAKAFFSEYVFDWRLTQAGKTRFGLAAFEIGLAGAIRTADRLMEIASSPFFSRYGRYVSRSPASLLVGRGKKGER